MLPDKMGMEAVVGNVSWKGQCNTWIKFVLAEEVEEFHATLQTYVNLFDI